MSSATPATTLQYALSPRANPRPTLEAGPRARVVLRASCDDRRMELTLVRHATLVLEIAGRRLLVDPMLDAAGARPAVADTPNQRPNPLVELPIGVDELVRDLDAVLVSHLHEDHLDETAVNRLAGGLPVLCQPADAERLAELGFRDVRAVEDEVSLDGLEVRRTYGRHGQGEVADTLAPVCGFVLVGGEEPTIYIAGDTIWCPEVETALAKHRPDVVVVNAGAACFTESDPITMTAADVLATAEHADRARLLAVHMDAVNHCLLSRSELRTELATSGVGERVLIPEDGEHLTF